MHARVHFDFERSGLRFSGNGQPRLVGSREDERTGRIASVINGLGDFGGKFIT